METSVILLAHYCNPADADHKLLRHIIRNYCPVYPQWDVYFEEPLRRIFKKVIVYDYLKRRAEIGVKAMNEEVVELTQREHPRYVLWLSFEDDIETSTLTAIKNTGSSVVGWFFDDEWRFSWYSRYWIPHLDFCVTNAVDAVPKYMNMGARVIHTVPNTGISIGHDWSRSEERYDVSFVGAVGVADRERYLAALKKVGMPVHLFGEGSGGRVSWEEMLSIFQTSKISLNFSKGGPYYWVRQIKGRVFQICMVGGFVLTEYAPGIEQYFEVGKEIVCFSSVEEMIHKINYYLRHDEERRCIARAGWERATREYTSSRMVARVFQQIELSAVTKDGKGPVLSQNPKPIWARLSLSRYEFLWARASLLEEDEGQGLWRDALTLTLGYTRFNIWAWFLRFLPSMLRIAVCKLYEPVEKFCIRLLLELRSISLVRIAAERLTR